MTSAAAFHRQHERAYGHTDETVPVELVNLRVDAFGRTPKAALANADGITSGSLEPAGHRPVCLDAAKGFEDVPVYRREDVHPGHGIEGPAVIIQRDTTTVLLHGQSATVAPTGVIRIKVAS